MYPGATHQESLLDCLNDSDGDGFPSKVVVLTAMMNSFLSIFISLTYMEMDSTEL